MLGPYGDPNEGIGLAARVLLHLAQLPRLGPNDIAPIERTQQGMVQRLGTRQGSLGKVLHRLCVGEVLRVEKSWVGGVNRRLKVYHLTPLGQAAAGDLLRRQTSGPSLAASAARTVRPVPRTEWDRTGA
jgi:DNA-binding PadR family transcriptional regulator